MFNCGVDHKLEFIFKPQPLSYLDDMESMSWELQSPDCSPSSIRKIRNKQIDSWSFAKTIASHPNCPTDTLDSIATQWQGQSDEIELSVIKNPNSTYLILEKLFPPKNEDIACAMISHKAVSESMLQRIYDRYHTDKKVVDQLAGSTASRELLERIWQEQNGASRRSMSTNRMHISMTKTELEETIQSSDEEEDQFWVNAIQLGCLKRVDAVYALKAFNKYKFSVNQREDVTEILRDLLLDTYHNDPLIRTIV
jgi:hypothetical protein